MSFHGVCPVGPDRAGYPDTPRNMKKSMDGERTGGKPDGIVFVVQAILIIFIRVWCGSRRRRLTFHNPPPTIGNPCQFDPPFLLLSQMLNKA